VLVCEEHRRCKHLTIEEVENVLTKVLDARDELLQRIETVNDELVILFIDGVDIAREMA